MNTIRPCGCKGVRTCLKCEQDYRIEKPSALEQLQKLEALFYCAACAKLYPGWKPSIHPQHDGHEGISFPGVLVQEEFLSIAEAEAVMETLDTQLTWANSQSGRRKQNFGPKTNFKKRKLQNGQFQGFPMPTAFIQERLRTVPLLNDFQAIEQCSLEYEPSKGASIDPHVDDCWIWGERVVTVNTLGDSVLTLTPLPSDVPANKYNLDCVSEYEKSLLLPLATKEQLESFSKHVIRIPMPNRSLIVLYGPARYQYEHAVLREDVHERRVCIAYREFTPMYLPNGKHWLDGGDDVTMIAMKFWKPEEYMNGCNTIQTN